MKYLPIPFQGAMVRAVLAGTKTQTRRVMKPQPEPIGGEGRHAHWSWRGGLYALRMYPEQSTLLKFCPYGAPGDRLWVREAWRTTYPWDSTPPRDLPGNVDLHYEADGRPNAHFCFGKLRPGMFLPRAASRIALEVTGVRVERLQDISEADAIAEGVERVVIGDGWRRYADAASEAAGLHPCVSARDSYASLWESINGPGSWAANPWCWCVSFKRIEAA
jgi:hypothetical protein